MGAGQRTLAADAADPPKATISPAQIVKVVEAAGYPNVRDLEFDDGRWELEATSPAGASVDLEVDANTGKVLRGSRLIFHERTREHVSRSRSSVRR